MIDAEYCRRRAEALLSEAGRTGNMKERGRLIDEAMHWHNLAIEAHERRAVHETEEGAESDRETGR